MTENQRHYVTLLAMVTLPVWIIPLILVGAVGTILFGLYSLVRSWVDEIDDRRGWRE